MNLTALSATLGVMFLPLGVYFVVEGRVEDKWFGFGFFLFGLLLLTATMLRVWNEDKKDRQEKEARDTVEYNRFELQTKILVGILDELKKLNKEGDNNDRRTNT